MTMLTRRAGLMLLPGALLPVAARAQPRQQGLGPVTGTISIEQTQVGFIVGVNWGGGTLHYGGKSYRFRVKGLGIGEIGVATLTARGNVYGLKRVLDFPGAYAQMQAAATGGFNTADAGLWIANTKGVRINLKAQRQGLQLTLATEGIVVEMG